MPLVLSSSMSEVDEIVAARRVASGETPTALLSHVSLLFDACVICALRDAPHARSNLNVHFLERKSGGGGPRCVLFRADAPDAPLRIKLISVMAIEDPVDGSAAHELADAMALPLPLVPVVVLMCSGVPENEVVGLMAIQKVQAAMDDPLRRPEPGRRCVVSPRDMEQFDAEAREAWRAAQAHLTRLVRDLGAELSHAVQLEHLHVLFRGDGNALEAWCGSHAFQDVTRLRHFHRCATCDVVARCLRCSGCSGCNVSALGDGTVEDTQLVRYCSPACQTADWPQHRTVCRARRAAAEGSARREASSSR